MLYDETFEGYKNKLKGLEPSSINYWPLIGKLNSLRFLNYEYFRKTIFECMNLIGGLEVPNELP